MHREDFTLCNHKLSLFQAEKADCPLFYLGLRKEIRKGEFYRHSRLFSGGIMGIPAALSLEMY